MSIEVFLVTPIAGGVIGAFTNYIAIRMLFRPHYPKYLFGVRIPFTPGLMPKERHRLAKKIGDTVAKHILTEDMLKSKMLSDENTESIAAGLLQTAEKFKPELCRAASGELVRFLRDEDVSPYIRQFLCYLRPIADEKGRSYFAGEDFKNAVAEKTDEVYNRLYEENRKLSSYLPDGALDYVQSLVEMNLPMVESFVRKALYENPQISAAAKTLLVKTIDNSVGTLASLFVNKDKAFDSVCAGVVEFLAKEENRGVIVGEVMEVVKKAADCDAQFILQRVPDDLRARLTEKTKELVSEELVGDLIDKSFGYLLGELDKNSPIRLYDIVSKGVSEDELEKLAEDTSEKLVNGLIALASEKLLSTENLRKALAMGINHMFSGIDVSKMAEEQINSLDIAEAEDIVVSVVKKELRAITAVGGVLGFIIGLLPGFLQGL